MGAVRFDLDGKILDRFVSFVACDRVIPVVVQRLTGITLDQLGEAPPPATVVGRLADFVGDAWVIGHNVDFDLGFVEGQGFPPTSARLDTAELASILFPSAPSYALQRLAAEVRSGTRAHRALDDAEAAALLLVALFREASSLSPATLEGLLQLAEPLGDAVAWFLGEALAARARAVFVPPAPDGPAAGLVALPAQSMGRAGLAGKSIRELFASHGVMTAAFEAYEERAEQIEMAEAVDNVMRDGGALVVEAGTGTGKSLAYLVPALRAVARGKRVLVSTHTTTLQDQLAASDLPRLARAFGLDSEVAVLKGRSNYLCPRRWHVFRLSAADADEARFAMKTLVWRERTKTGDRAELNLLGSGEQLAWARVCAEDETCTARRCAMVRGGCYLERARAAAARAPLVVANHALVLSDARSRNRLLPDVDIVVADEAHHLDEVASHVFGVRVTAADIRRAVQRASQAASAAAAADVDLVPLRNAAQMTLVSIEETFLALGRLMRDPSERGYEDQRRITPALRGSDEWLAAELAAERLRDGLATVERCGVTLLAAAHDPALADASAEFESALAELRGLDAAVNRVVHLPPRGEICWLSLDQTGALALQSAPAHAGVYIDRALARERHAAVFTSATLAVAGSFGFVLDRFGLGDRAATLRVGSGFDYRRQALLVLPTGLVDPYDSSFVDQTAAVVADVATRLDGRTLVLFTSHSMLRAVHSRLGDWAEEQRLALLAQSVGGSRRQLLEQFVGGRAVLLGTATFWEGIDLPGELLQCVIVAKLPFPVPDDPVVAGRSERYEDPFREYHVPVAALRLRQGFGRLIRTRDDRGAVVLLDRRLASRAYGETFLRSLPDCQVTRPDLQAVGAAVAEWCEAGRQEHDRRLE
ncbi:MAG: hypothetical protein AUH85_02280 [Chloroflexi bacterium 13_1_40CM_4_68_4]|nr:MAG: hypothetical protein AUH85_02280 [Chloroflexi bacterium 13_1_40CM_4_68_4]